MSKKLRHTLEKTAMALLMTSLVAAGNSNKYSEYGPYACVAEALGAHPQGGLVHADFTDLYGATTSGAAFDAILSSAVLDTTASNPFIVTSSDNNAAHTGKTLTLTMAASPPPGDNAFALSADGANRLTFGDGTADKGDAGTGAAGIGERVWIATAGTVSFTDYAGVGQQLDFKIVATFAAKTPGDAAGTAGTFDLTIDGTLNAVVKPGQ